MANLWMETWDFFLFLNNNLTAPGLSCGMQDLLSSLWLVSS